MQELTKRPVPLPFRAAGVPQAMKDEARWCVWRYEHRDGSWTKVPVNARTGGRGQSNNRSTWSTYGEALAAFNDDREGLAGLGFFLGDRWIGVDVDDCIDSLTDERTALAQEVIDHVPGYAETSPSGEGLKVITRGSIPHTRTRKGLELYADGRFFAITGHKIERPNDASETLGVIDCDLTQFYELHFGSASARPSVEDTDLNALLHAKGPIGEYDIERVRDELLVHLPCESYKEWLDVGMALHHQGEAGDEWLELWDEWSQAGSTYAEGVCEAKWEGFGNDSKRESITLGSLIHIVKGILALAKYDREAHYATKIAAATDKVKLQDEIPREIALDLGVDAKVREDLAQLIKRRIKALFQTSQPISAVRSWVKPTVSHDRGNAPVWVRPYVYVADEERFLDAERRLRFTRESFNAKHNRDMPKNDAGDPIKPAATGATDLYGIPVVDSALYQPALGRFFVFDGRECVNIYDDSQIPRTAVLTDDEEAAVALVKRHLLQMLPNDRERQLFTNWLAYVVQNPGKKIRWAPYLCGVPGDGKSFFGVLLGAVMGARNFRSLSGDMLKQPYTDWAVGVCATLIEEVKLHGADKFDAVNKLKPFITNDVVDVRPMFRAPYNAPNTVNYMIASNYIDGMPITEDDRRFMILQSAFSAERLKAFNDANPDFYTELFSAVETFPGAMRSWLLYERDWHPDFKPDGKAPVTAARGLAIELNESDADSACRTVFDSRPGGVTGSWVAIAAFVSAVAAELGPRSDIRPAALKRICTAFLSGIGFRYMGDERHRVGPERTISRFWCHESVCQSRGTAWHNWWAEAEPIIKKSYADAVGKDFLS
jgi:hypothetical protein